FLPIADTSHLRRPGPSSSFPRGRCARGTPSGHTAARVVRPTAWAQSIRSYRVARRPLHARQNLSKERPRPGFFGELKRKVPCVPDQPSPGLEQPLLETREGPVLDRDGQQQPTQQVAEVVGDHAEEQAHLVRPKPMAGEAVLPSLIHCSAVPRWL